MRLKSYFSGTVESAIQLARRELGPDAMLVDSRPAVLEARHLGEYEVIFATQVPPAPSAEDQVGKRGADAPGIADLAAAATATPQAIERVSREVSELRKQLQRMAEVFGRSSAMVSGKAFPEPEYAELFGGLVSAGLDAMLAQDILHRVRIRYPRDGRLDRCGLRRALAAELESSLRVEAHLGQAGAQRRIVALVGPPGSGKTTALVKLAVKYGLEPRRPVQIVSLDNYRIAAAEQMRCYATILGVGFQLLDTALALDQSLAEFRHKELILLDTPGYSAADLEDAADLARALARHPEIDTHLVLPASMKPADLRRVTDHYEAFLPGKLLFTKLDETETFGCIWNEALRTGKPVSFLANGQRIPEDLEPADKVRLLDLLLDRDIDSSAVAA